ncbi:MAG: site-2 protease family protein [Vicinamibacterales bacterium]
MANIDFTQVFIVFLVLLFSLTIHEAAHAWSADRLGDPTARLLGRVSLNPAVHVDPIGTIVFPLIALMTSLPILGWAKPVPVSTPRLGRNWKEKFMMIAAAGPASNILIAVGCSIALRLVEASVDEGGGGVGMAGSVLVLAIRLNVLLAVFNMIPVPPLDGGNVLAGLLHGRAAAAYDGLRQYGFIILYALMFSGVLWRIVLPPQNVILSWLL